MDQKAKDEGWSELSGGGLIPPEIEQLKIRKILGRQEKGAIYNGRRVRKVNSEPGDHTPDGTEGTVLGSIGSNETIMVNGQAIQFGYLINWDHSEADAVFTTNLKVEEL
jgi:hypothetical protein